MAVENHLSRISTSRRHQGRAAVWRHSPIDAVAREAHLLAGSGDPRRFQGSMQSVGRDLRLDFFRGVALLMIFANHIPGNVFTNFTIAAYGLCDAAEMFVLVAGISSYLAFGRALMGDEKLRGLLTLYARVWTLYVSHLTMFIGVLGITAYAALQFSDDSYLENLGFDVFVAEPTVAVLRALTLTFLPNYLDILPLYIVLLSALPLMTLLLGAHPLALLATSAALYAAAITWQFNLPNFQAARVWFFNPFAWQFLFSIGYLIGHAMNRGWSVGRFRLPLTVVAAAYVLFALAVQAPWTRIEGFEPYTIIPGDLLPPIDKTNLSLFRLADILAKMWLVAVLVRPQAAFFSTLSGRLMSHAGKHSLEIFSVGIILSMIATVAVRQMSFDLRVQIAVNLTGMAIMVLWALFLEWKERAVQRRAPVPRQA
jgi:hypothetical protein